MPLVRAVRVEAGDSGVHFDDLPVKLPIQATALSLMTVSSGLYHLSQEFEKEAEAERVEIGNRAVRLMERRTNQLLRMWSISRLSRCGWGVVRLRDKWIFFSTAWPHSPGPVSLCH